MGFPYNFMDYDNGKHIVILTLYYTITIHYLIKELIDACQQVTTIPSLIRNFVKHLLHRHSVIDKHRHTHICNKHYKFTPTA